MHVSLLLFLIVTLLSSLTHTSDYEEIKEKLSHLSEQIERVESLLNSSIDNLFNKIDSKTHTIIDLIKSHRTSQADGNSRPVNALLIIDVQNDFINGSLALRNCPSKHNGEEVIPVINHLLDSVHFDVVVYTHDWHPNDHISFFDNLHLRSHLLANHSIPLADLQLYSMATFDIADLAVIEQTLWPRHCVQNTFGAEIHTDLKVLDKQNAEHIPVIHIYKGTASNIDSYSAFWDNLKLSETKLHKKLKEKNVTQIFVTGLATDWCVYSTALHGIEHGYKTFIVEDACRGVDETAIKNKLQDYKERNGHVIQSNQVKDYIQ